MMYIFTVTAKLVAEDEFDEVIITSGDVNVDSYPDKAAVVRGVGFKMICEQLEQQGYDKTKLGQVCGIDVSIDVLLWESL